MSEGLLPVHGFVLAGGKSSRMGMDKALLQLDGRPMVQLAVEKLRSFCADVSIAGNRDDLSCFAPVVHEERMDAGPGAGIEAGLRAAQQPWAMFIPVDVPLVPADLLRRWATLVLAMGAHGLHGFSLHIEREQPAFCILNRGCLEKFSDALNSGECRVSHLLHAAAGGLHQAHGIGDLYKDGESPTGEAIARWFLNVNTPRNLAAAESLIHAAAPYA